MRGLKVLLTSLTMLLVICAPALAQSAPAASQYRTNTCPKGVDDGPQQDQVDASAGDAACAAADSTGQGTDAVNDALNGASSSASAPAEGSASTESSASAESSASPEGGDVTGSGTDAASADGEAGGDDRALASLEELPETGGAPLMVLGSGLALTTLGLVTRKVVGR